MLRFCEIPAKGACCHNGMELKLASLSRQQLEKNTKESISKLASVLGTRATKFNGKLMSVCVCVFNALQTFREEHLGGREGNRTNPFNIAYVQCAVL